MTRLSAMATASQLGLLAGRMLQAVMAVELAGAAASGNWWVAFIAALALLTSFLPAALQRNTRVHLPVGYQLIVTGFIFAALLLGEISDFYWRYWWWDLVLHTLSGMILGLVAFLSLFTLFDCDRVRMHPILLSVLAISIAVATGTIWEVFEFGMDQSFGLNMQRATLSDSSGLGDTMSDLIVNALGAALIITGAHMRLTRKRGRRWVKEFASQFVDPPPNKASHRYRHERDKPRT